MNIKIEQPGIDDEIIYRMCINAGIPFAKIHITHDSFEQYMTNVYERNNFKSDVDITFGIGEEYIKSKIYHFVECWQNGLSPYKALTFLDNN